MSPPEPAECSSFTTTEYEQANEWWRTLSKMRRQDLATFTTIQGAAFTIIGDKLLELDGRGIALSGISFLVTLIGLNNERRIYSHLAGFRKRALDIESSYGGGLLKAGMDHASETRLVLGSQWAFGLYYTVILLGWAIVWVLNILSGTP